MILDYPQFKLITPKEGIPISPIPISSVIYLTDKYGNPLIDENRNYLSVPRSTEFKFGAGVYTKFKLEES